MPAVARSPVYGPRCRPSFGATEIPHFGNHNVGPNHLHHLLGSLCSHPCDQFCFSRARVPVSESLCGPQNWTNAHSGRARLAWCPESEGCILGPKTSTKRFMLSGFNVGRARHSIIMNAVILHALPGLQCKGLQCRAIVAPKLRATH